MLKNRKPYTQKKNVSQIVNIIQQIDKDKGYFSIDGQKYILHKVII